MSGPIPPGLWATVETDAAWAILAITILLYVARLPAKRRYYLPFMLYCGVAAGFSVLEILTSFVTPQVAFNPISKLIDLIGPTNMFALQYYFVLNFTTSKKNWFQKYTLLGAFGFCLIFETLEVFGLQYTGDPGYGIMTPTGYEVPVPNAAWYKLLQSPTIPIINHNFTYDYVIITLLSLYALLSYYRSTKSSFVRSQIRYLSAGVVTDWVAIVYHGFVVQKGSPLYGTPDFQTYIYVGTMIIFLVGVTRHQFRKVTPTAETAAAVPQTYALEEGRSYLSRDNDSAFAAFSELVKNGREGLCVTRILPDDVRRTYGLQTTPIRWLSEEKREDAISATDLLGISVTVKDFMEKAKKPIVILQGLEYLVRVNGFSPVIRLLDGLYEKAGETNGILLIPVSPNTLETREDAMLVAQTTPQPLPRPT